MKHIKTFEGLKDDPYKPRIFRIGQSTSSDSSPNLVLRHKREGRFPYLVDENMNLEKLLVSDKGLVYREKNTETNNRYGRPISKTIKEYIVASSLFNSKSESTLYFLSDEEVKELKPKFEKIRELIIKIDKSKSLVKQLFNSIIIELSQKNKVEIDEN
jgi:hypothetical protein